MLERLLGELSGGNATLPLQRRHLEKWVYVAMLAYVANHELLFRPGRGISP